MAAKLQIPYSTIAGICNGSRGIGRGLAKRMADADPALDESILVWVTAARDESSLAAPKLPDAA